MSAAMGDMKTPDFDDLLAAFDIPDATSLDAKETIHASKGESDSQLRPTGTCLEEDFHPTISTTVPAVSVIVTNSSQHESLDSGVERSHSTDENGLSGQETVSPANTSDFSKPFGSLWNGDSSSEFCELVGSAPLQQKPSGTFSQPLSDFSIASTGPEAASNEETHPNRQADYFSNGLMEHIYLDTSKDVISEEFKKDTQTDDKRNEAELSHFQLSFGSATDETPNSHSERIKKPISSEASESANIPIVHAKAESKLSPCLEALAALNAQTDPSELTVVQNEYMKASPKAILSPGSPRSPLDSVKRLMKPSDSPVSVCSDSSGKFSPAVASPPAIPRVRIKTIKTSSGHIRRTVASVLPDSETDEVLSAYESSPCQSTVSEDSYNICPQNVKTSSKIVPNKANTISRKLQSSTSSKNKRQSVVHKVQKPKKSIEVQSSTNTNQVPKAMHLASLNLVPHSVAASVAARFTCNQSLQTVSSSVYSSVPLVHQVNTPCPSPPNTAVGTLNRLLNYANPVPTYMPDLNPPAESNISLPPRGYRCLECGDSFSVERSLKYHYSRRSVHIEVTCTHCRKTLLFFNRCALLAHAREHKMNGTVMQCTQLYMKPITEEQMFVPLSAGSSNVESCLFKSSTQKNQPVMPLYQEDHVARQSLCCMECNLQCPDLKALAGHYQRVSEATDRLMCKVCSMILPNKCSLRAHQRLHAHKSPYCCPECGAQSRSADLQNHVKDNCLHYARKAWYKCLHCDVMFKSLQGQKSHIGEKHCEMFFKCTVCPVAFKSPDRCEGHLKTKHSAINVSPQLIFKCSCESVFKKKHLLYQHFHEDAYKRVKCVFQCPKCHSVFDLKQHLMQHFKGTHIMLGAAEKSWKQIHRADQDYTTLEKKTVSSVKRTDAPQRNRETTAKRGKRYPCQHCDLSFNFITSLRKHIRKDHNEKRKKYVCWYCTDATRTFTSSVMLKNHMSLMHGVKNPDFTRMPKTLESNESSRKGLGSPVLGPKRDKGDDPGGGEAPAEKRLKTCFRCATCDFVTTDCQEFEQHIPQHKAEESTPQCHCCGLCFTSALALNRHLHIVHKIREPENREPEGKTVVQSQSRGQ